jgi:hypothetical protein
VAERAHIDISTLSRRAGVAAQEAADAVRGQVALAPGVDD